MIVTIWIKYDDKKKDFLFNHFEEGLIHNNKPYKMINKFQKSKWSKAKWRKSFGVLIEQKLIYEGVV